MRSIHLSFLTLLFCAVLSNSLIASAQNTSTKTKLKAPETHMSPPFRIYNPETMAKPSAGYSQVAEITGGKIVYIAGQVATDKAGNLVGKDDFRAQLQQVFENLRSAVEASGGDFKS